MTQKHRQFLIGMNLKN